MNYELCKQLKEAGYPQKEEGIYWMKGGKMTAHAYEEHRKDLFAGYIPTLEELIEACGTDFRNIEMTLKPSVFWHATGVNISTTEVFTSYHAPTPTEAVARLWLALTRDKEGVV